MPNPQTPAVDAAREAFAAWRAQAGRDWLADDPGLTWVLGRRPALEPELRRYAAACAGELDGLARNTNRDENLPRLDRYDSVGVRTEGVAFHPDHHRIGAAVWGSGVLARYASPGAELETLALLYLTAQNGEAGHCCPLACTAGMIKVLDGVEGVPAEWRRRLLSRDYAEKLHASQFLTEVQGGSDVGSNALHAGPPEAGDPPGAARLHGEKWFCSVIDAELFLVTARPAESRPGTAGLAAFVVPRRWEGRPNGFRIRRLKYKLGTRSMASAEVDFEGALGLPVGDFRKVVEIVLNTSRVYNAVCAAGFVQRAWREADAYARSRLAFGRPILDFPVIARIVARLRVEAAAARSLSFALGELLDGLAGNEAALDGLAGLSPRDAQTAFRMLVNLNKGWTALTCPAAIRDAIEVFGGNGAIEEFSVLPRLLRDSIVLEAWEGGHGVLAAQLRRDAQKGLDGPMWAWLAARAGDGAEGEADRARLEAARLRWARVVADPRGEEVFRDVLDELRPVVQVLVMRTQGAPSAWVEHLRTTNRRGWDPLEDEGLMGRVREIVG